MDRRCGTTALRRQVVELPVDQGNAKGQARYARLPL
jgi:hypothetical protein